jgi:hypothetical protein
MRHGRPPFPALRLPEHPPCPPWVELLRTAAETLAPFPEDQTDPEVARATCQPWSVWVGTQRLTVVYEAPPQLGDVFADES